MLESSLISILLAAEDSGKIQITKPKKQKDVEMEIFLSSRTLGQLVLELKSGGIEDALIELIEDALQACNYLMHHFFVWNTKEYQTDEGRGRMLKELQELRFRIGRSEVVFGQVRDQLIEKLYGISPTRVKELYDDYERARASDT